MPAAIASIRTMPKLSPASEGATSTSASPSARQSTPCETLPSTSIVLGHLGIGDPALDLLGIGADHRQPGRDVLDQRLEGGEQDRQALALLGAADEQQAEVVGRLASGPRGADSTSTPLGTIVYSPPNQRSAVQAAAWETAIRAESWLKIRRAPSRLAMRLGSGLVE